MNKKEIVIDLVLQDGKKEQIENSSFFTINLDFKKGNDIKSRHAFWWSLEKHSIEKGKEEFGKYLLEQIKQNEYRGAELIFEGSNTEEAKSFIGELLINEEGLNEYKEYVLKKIKNRKILTPQDGFNICLEMIREETNINWSKVKWSNPHGTVVAWFSSIETKK